MDTSGQYIKMCEKAEEIQKLGRDITDINNYYSQQASGLIWLPRQDQLQEIVKSQRVKSKSSYILLNRLWVFVTGQPKMMVDYSMEQLWLAFVMNKKYRKVWDGEDWKEVSQ